MKKDALIVQSGAGCRQAGRQAGAPGKSITESVAENVRAGEQGGGGGRRHLGGHACKDLILLLLAQSVPIVKLVEGGHGSSESCLCSSLFLHPSLTGCMFINLHIQLGTFSGRMGVQQ